MYGRAGISDSQLSTRVTHSKPNLILTPIALPTFEEPPSIFFSSQTELRKKRCKGATTCDSCSRSTPPPFMKCTSKTRFEGDAWL